MRQRLHKCSSDIPQVAKKPISGTTISPVRYVIDEASTTGYQGRGQCLTLHTHTHTPGDVIDNQYYPATCCLIGVGEEQLPAM